MIKKILLFLQSFILLGCGLLHTSKPAVTATQQATPSLIRDCPEELIQNRMPMMDKGSSSQARDYYIYKGKRHEIAEFDQAWVKANCQVKVTVVQ